jgi:hypothetical protein
MLFQKSADTKVIESVLKEAKVGELVTYAAISKAIGRDVREHASGALNTARRALQKECNYVFAVEAGEGLRRLSDTQIVDSTVFDRAKMHRAANRSLKKLGTVDFKSLPEDSQKQHVIASAQLGVVALFSGKNASKKIEGNVNGSKETLAIGQTLKMFS